MNVPMRYLFAAILLAAGCKGAIEKKRKESEEILAQFDSINNSLKEIHARQMKEDTASGSAQRIMDSFLNHTTEGRRIKAEVTREIDSISAQRTK